MMVTVRWCILIVVMAILMLVCWVKDNDKPAYRAVSVTTKTHYDYVDKLEELE